MEGLLCLTVTSWCLSALKTTKKKKKIPGFLADCTVCTIPGDSDSLVTR